MAFALKLIGVKWSFGQYELVELGGEMGMAYRFLNDPRFREMPGNSGYMDSFAVLSPSETLEILRPHPASGDPGRPTTDAPELDARLNEIEAALNRCTVVLAHLYEWESGYG